MANRSKPKSRRTARMARASAGARSAATTPAQRLFIQTYQSSHNVLADACARIGGDVGCYSFIAVDFHHILLASLPAHSLALRPAHSRGHQFVTRYPKASDISSPPCLLRLLPAGAVAGRGLHPLESAALSRRTPFPDIRFPQGR